MKIFSTILIYALAIPLGKLPIFSQPKDETANTVLQKVLNQLNACKTIEYKYYRSINYFSEDFHAETKGNTFLDFRSSDTILGFKYQFNSDQSRLVFNGKESFAINKKDSTLKIKLKPQLTDFTSLSFLLNSVVTLKKVLSAVIADDQIEKTLQDTTVNQRDFYLVSFALQNKTISNLGGFTKTTIQRSFLYKIAIDKKTHLPLFVIQTNNAQPKDYMLTSFTEFKLNTHDPSESSWYYSTYTNEYKLLSEKRPVLIKENMVAPDWQSEEFNNTHKVTLSKLKGSAVLLEFWIKNCGYCIEAVPKLNSLVEKYKNEKLQVIGVNTQDNKEEVNSFYQRTRPNFNTINDSDGRILNTYGVEAFPTIVLIDKKGIVLYSGNFDSGQIDRLLKEALK